MATHTKSLAESVELLIDKLGFRKKMKEQQILQDWAAIVGPQIGKISKAEKVYESVLYVRVASSSWRTELMFQKHSILKQIEQRYGKNVITDFRFI
jgi:predicted nucleic acid-binding Zn ribbon protein